MYIFTKFKLWYFCRVLAQKTPRHRQGYIVSRNYTYDETKNQGNWTQTIFEKQINGTTYRNYNWFILDDVCGLYFKNAVKNYNGSAKFSYNYYTDTKNQDDTGKATDSGRSNP